MNSLFARKNLKLGSLVAFLFLSFTPQLHAFQIIGPLKIDQAQYETSIDIMGSADLSRVKAPELTVSGPLLGQDIQVKGALMVLGPVNVDQLQAGATRIRGSLSGDKIDLEQLDLVGPLNVSHFNVKGLCQVIGPVAIRNGNLSHLEVIGDEVDLEDVVVKELVFKRSDPPVNAPRLILRGSSCIEGGVNFESGDGQVNVVGPNAAIKGQVKGVVPFDLPNKALLPPSTSPATSSAN